MTWFFFYGPEHTIKISELYPEAKFQLRPIHVATINFDFYSPLPNLETKYMSKLDVGASIFVSQLLK